MSACTYNSVDFSSLGFGEVMKNSMGMKQVYLSTKPGSRDPAHRLRFQMSTSSEPDDRQTLLWGLSAPLSGGDATRLTMDLTVENPELEAQLRALDAAILQAAIDRSQEWFGKPLERAAIENMYVPVFKEPYKEGAFPTVRTKVNVGDRPANVYKVEATTDADIDYCKSDSTILTKNAKAVVVVEVLKVWFLSSKQFGVSLSVTDALVWPVATTTGIDSFNLGKTLKKVADDDAAAMMDY